MRLFDGWRDWVQRVVGKIVVNFGPHTIHRLVAGLGLCLYHGVISISVTGTGTGGQGKKNVASSLG